MPESSNRPPLFTSAGGRSVGSTSPAFAGGPLGPPEAWMMTAALPLSWSELPPELLGLILKRLPSLADRVGLRAVCHPWRFNAQLQPLPPPLPWLSLLDGTVLSIPDGKIFQIPIPDGACCCGSIDNWLFLMQSDGRCSLMNPFSNTTLDLPDLGTIWRRDWFNANDRFKPLFFKLVIPSPLDISPDSIVAVLITDDGNYRTICICQHPIATDLYRGKHGDPLYLLDEIEFFGGKLYGTAFRDKLLIIEIADGLENEPMISSAQCIIDSTDHFDSRPEHLPDSETTLGIRKYLVKCGVRLLMVERWLRNMDPGHRTGPDYLKHECTVAFQVFEADLSANPGRWKKVSKLGGHALFVGQHCSKSFPAGECNGIQEDCIYFMCDYPWPECAADPLRDSGVYNIKTGAIMPLLSETAAVLLNHGGQCRPAWFFPAESM